MLRRVRRLTEFGQYTETALGMHKRDLRLMGARARDLIDHPQSGCLELRNASRDIIDREG